MEPILRPISLADPYDREAMDSLLQQEGLRRDRNLDYSCGIFDEEEQLIATGSCFGNTIRCLAVSSRHRGQGLLVRIVSHLLQIQAGRGNLHIFLYTKLRNLPFFKDLGFYEIARVGDDTVFLENRRDGFRRYCEGLPRSSGDSAAVVMNANPFTLGHRHLLEQAAGENPTVYLFLLSENAGPIPHRIRRRLVEEGIRDLPNVILVETGPYLISSATFPTYFLKDADEAVSAQAMLDGQVFCAIARHLGIRRRYLGEEPRSHVTGIYNSILSRQLPEAGIECRILPRLTAGERVISASDVREAIRQDQLDTVRDMLPDSTYSYFSSQEAEPVRRAIREEASCIHH